MSPCSGQLHRWGLRALVLPTALALSLAGCAQLRVAHDPGLNGGAAEPALLYSVDWWHRLVTDVPLLEYQPREPAGPEVDVEQHKLVVLTRDGFIRCFSDEGKALWSLKTHGRFLAGARFKDGVVYVGGADGVLYALDEATGKPRWQYDTNEELASPVSFAGNLVLIASQTDTLFAVDATTGKWVWQYRRETPNGFTIRGVSGPMVANDTVYIGFSDGHLVALNRADGGLRWDKTLSSGPQFIDVDATPVADGAGLLFTASYKDGIYALDADTGEVRWHRQVPGITRVSLLHGLLVAAGDEVVAGYTPDKGTELWRTPLKTVAGRQPVVAGGFLLVPTVKSLLFLEPKSGKTVLSFDPGKGVSATPAVSGAHVYVLSNNGYLYALRMAKRGS